MTSTLRGVGVGVKAKISFIGCRGRGLASVVDVQSLFFFIKENWICAVTRYHVEPNINILSKRNLLFDSEVRQ